MACASAVLREKMASLKRDPNSVKTEWAEKNVLPRRLFLASYSLLNLILFWEVCTPHTSTPTSRPASHQDCRHGERSSFRGTAQRVSCPFDTAPRHHRPHLQAFVRHGDSDKGRALRGEAFNACVVNDCTAANGGPCFAPCAGGSIAVPENAVLKEAGTGTWYPWAKGFGQLLNLNCAFMLLPVVRSLVMWLHNATSFRTPCFLAWVPYILPCAAASRSARSRAHGHQPFARAALLRCRLPGR